MLWLKCTGTNEEQTRLALKLTTEKIWCYQETIKFEHVLQILVHTDMSSIKRGLLQRRNSKNNRFVVKPFLESNSSCFCNTAIREKFKLKLDPQVKKLFPRNGATTFTKQGIKRDTVTNFYHLYLNNIWAPSKRPICISKGSSFFYFSLARNTFQRSTVPPTSRCLNKLQ